MHRVLGNGKESEAAAFFLRIASLSYTVPFTVTPAVAERFNTHKGLW